MSQVNELENMRLS